MKKKTEKYFSLVLTINLMAVRGGEGVDHSIKCKAYAYNVPILYKPAIDKSQRFHYASKHTSLGSAATEPVERNYY